MFESLNMAKQKLFEQETLCGKCFGISSQGFIAEIQIFISQGEKFTGFEPNDRIPPFDVRLQAPNGLMADRFSFPQQSPRNLRAARGENPGNNRFNPDVAQQIQGTDSDLWFVVIGKNIDQEKGFGCGRQCGRLCR